MKHKLTKYQSTSDKELNMVSVFLLTADFGKFKKGEIFEEFYTASNRYYAVSSNLFKSTCKSGHTKIIKSRDTKFAPVSFFRKIRKEDSMLFRLHHNGFENLNPVEYKQM